jgi:hypothetical protein
MPFILGAVQASYGKYAVLSCSNEKSRFPGKRPRPILGDRLLVFTCFEGPGLIAKILDPGRAREGFSGLEARAPPVARARKPEPF